MINSFRYCATLAFVMAAAVGPATAQFQFSFPWSTSSAPAVAAKPAVPTGPNIVGSWSGQLASVGGSTPINIELAVTTSGVDTKYPDFDCTGKLRRLGSSKSYVSFVEIIAKGRADKGGRCPDGSVTITRQGDNLTLVWFGSIQGNAIVEYGTLAKKQPSKAVQN
jgi:hypothetical protein